MSANLKGTTMIGGLDFWVDKPIWLFLLLLLIPAFLLARRSIGGLSRRKAIVTFVIRAAVIALLALALSEPNWARRGKGLTAMILIDRSDSIPKGLKQSSLEFLAKAAKAKENPQDRVGVIEIAKDASITAMPDAYSAVPTPRDDGDLTATNLAAGVSLALALMPDDTANRIILASDGNETVDSVLGAAEVAKSNHIPIDVVLLEFEHEHEVIFERVVAPARARFAETVPIKLVLRSQGTASGTVTLTMNDEQLDLNGPDHDGMGLHLALEPGPAKVIPITVKLDQAGPHQFEAKFEPDDPAFDRIAQNNRAVAVTFVSSEGRVLVLEDSRAEADPLVSVLQQSKIAVDRTSPERMGSVVALSAYDAVILANIPRWSLDDQQDRDLHNYVHDLGGGLVMLGGPQSFGAGGWLDTEVAKVLPVKLDPPSIRQMPRGALVLIMHSCEMAQGNYWAEKTAIAAIEALSRLDYVGILDYDWGAVGGLNWAYPLQTGDKAGAVAAAKKLRNGDMPDFNSIMQMALNGLQGINAGKRHCIVITDGDPSPPTQGLIDQFVAASISVTTIMFAGHGTGMDVVKMKWIAESTGGTFYQPKNPNQLPQIFIKEAKLVSRSLIVEGDTFQPQVVSRLPGPVEGFNAVPAISGYVLTSAREGLAQLPIVNAAMMEGQRVDDPIYADWNYGLGRAIAYTSDLSGRWGSQWVGWDQFKAFWERSIRWVMRPSSPANFTVTTWQEGDKAFVEVEALEADASFLNFLKTGGIVLGPDGRRISLNLQQTGPGRYRGEFGVDDAGAYLVNISYSAGTDEKPIKGSVQAAVAVPYSREFRFVKHNAALLEELARQTGGRVIMPTDPQMADLFNRENLEVPRSPKRVWDLVAIIAAALFVFDVAARRVSVDPKAIAAMAARATGRRAEAGTESMAAWKKARSQVAHRRIPTEAEKPPKTVKFEASAEDAARAIDVGAERPADRTPQERAVKPAEQQPEEDDGDYTSRLLAAKRRARGQDGGGPGAGPGAGESGGPGTPGSPKGGRDA